MGVTGLWTVVAPTARPTQLASLNRKRLAVDASIWIYQFLKAVRDKEGNALRNSHVVGFFRRICKLLYFGIKPVFVFDGGAPVLKRETIRRRKRRREGRREDAARTAGKLLAVQVARAAEEEDRRRKEGIRRDEEEELPADQDLVYVEEIGMNQKERQAGRNEKFRKKDQYHLPNLDVSLEAMGAPNDPRIMSQAELEDYARQFHTGEDINVYDFSKIDFESPFFLSLPAGDRYNILNAARLRSRLRMGYSKEQLDGMFPDRMAFSKFQIERVKERNELTQRLMHLNGMIEGNFLLDGGGRIAGEKGKEYILVRNEGVEGGWALGVVSNKEGTGKENAIDLDRDENSDDDLKRGDSADEEEFEDVAIEGLNRVPKTWARKRKADTEYDMSYERAAEEIAKKRKAVYEGRRAAADASANATLQAPKVAPAPRTTNPTENEDSLFIPDDNAVAEDEDDLFEDVLPVEPEMDEDDDLQRAIAMSLEQPTNDEPLVGGFVPNEHPNASAQDSDDDDGFDLQVALAESRRTKTKTHTNVRDRSPPKSTTATPKFDGPLPFESLNLGQSLLGKKKSKKIEEDLSGGFDRELGDDAFRKERPPQPVPDWFNATPNPKDLRYSGVEDANDDDHITYGRDDADRRETIRRHNTKEVIDLDAEDGQGKSDNPIDLDGDANRVDHTSAIELDEENRLEEAVSASEKVNDDPLQSQPEPIEISEVDEPEDHEKRARDDEREKRYELARQIAAENGTGEPEDQAHPTMGEMAEEIQAQPPLPSYVPRFNPQPQLSTATTFVKEAEESDFEQVEWSESEDEHAAQQDSPGSLGTVEDKSPRSETTPERAEQEDDDEDEGDEDFEDVDMQPVSLQGETNLPPESEPLTLGEEQSTTDPPAMATHETLPDEEFDYLSSDEEELMRQLAEEAEEHARFTSALQNQVPISTEQAMRDFDEELKSLRSQQKRDRRDADEVTQTMIQECQSLLRHFGLPYITAPMEAEAQCAELVRLGLVDGIVTDDSDIFLFGGTRIYKNMFNAAKYVECYLATDLEKEFLLDRRKLVRFAHLLGSDYTEGIPGVGPVTALEILTDFEDLETFKTWCDDVQHLSHLPTRAQDLEANPLLNTAFRRKFRKTVQKRLFLPPHFPDTRVDDAYLYPEVDSNNEPFQWGVPDLDRLRQYLMATIGWSQERTDEVLVPVIRDMNRREVEGTQSNITRYFTGSVGAGASGGGGLHGVRGGNKVLARGGEGPAPGGGGGGPGGFGPAQVQAEAMAPRNRTGKESGRMKKAFKKLQGEAKKQRRRGANLDDEEGTGRGEKDADADAMDVDALEGLGDIQALSADEGEDEKTNRDDGDSSAPTSLIADDASPATRAGTGSQAKRKAKKTAAAKRKA